MKRTSSNTPKNKTRPAFTPEARENQLISLAIDCVEERLRNGTASSQEVTHFLKLASKKARLEQEILEKQKELIEAKTESLKSEQRIEELYTQAVNAMRSYSGQTNEDN